MAFSAFLRNYLMRGGRYVPPGETFEAFQRHFEATEFDPSRSRPTEAGGGVERDPPGPVARPDPEVEAALEGLRQLESSTTSRCC